MYNWLSYYGNGYDAQQWTQQQRAQNVDIIAGYFLDNGWTPNAVAAMLGNMQAESYINPGQWQHGYPVGSYSPTCGYGLVQWTPWYEKIGPWTDNDLTNYDLQLTRIQYEVDNNIQWENDRPGIHYDESFYDFTQSTASIDYLTRCFFWCYEYGTWSDNRITWANYWYTYITDNPPPPPTPGPSPHPRKSNAMNIGLYLKPFWKRGY